MSKFIPLFFCNTCRQSKPRDEMRADSRGGRPTRCKSCGNASVRAWHAANPGQHTKFKRKYILRTKYGMTIEAHTAMLQLQFYKCAACGDKLTPEGKMKDPVVDHDHATGAVRGILCRQCNLTLGRAKDDVGRLEKLIAYLRRHS